MSPERIRITHEGHVADVRLTRGDKHNALDGATLRELHDSLIRVEQDERVRVVVLTGPARASARARTSVT